MKLRYKVGLGFLGVIGLALTTLAIAMSYTSACPAPVADTSGDNTMTAIRARCYGGPEVISVEQVAMPEVGDNDVLVKVRSAAVNPLDWHYMRGAPYMIRLFAGLGAPDDPTVGVDFAGTVVAVGSQVGNFQVGDNVFGGRSGAFADYVAVPADRALVHKPDNVSFDQAAAVPIAAITALQALRDQGKLQPGESVLINGASGGVGSFAVQIAKAMGAEVTGVCSARNIELVLGIGADDVVDYKKQSYPDLNPRYDLIVDMVGNHSVLTNRSVLKPGGRLVMVGGDKGNWLAPFKGVAAAAVLNPFYEEEFTSFTASMKPEDLATLAEMMAAGKIRPLLDRNYTLRGAAEALRYSESGRARGKIIINVSRDDTLAL